MGKKTFVFNIEWRDVLKDYPAEIRHEVYDAIVDYAALGIVLQLSPLAQMAFQFIKREMDYNEEKYQERVRAKSEGGKKAMEKRWGKRENITTDNKDNIVIPVITTDNINDYDNEYDYDKGMTITNTSTAIAKPDFIELFNSAMKNFNAQIPLIKALSGEREGFLNARIHEYGLDAVKEVIQKAAASNFLNGGGQNGWVADCTWILRPNNFIKILEGNYDNDKQQINNTYDRRQQAKQATLARQNAAIDRLIEEGTREWEERQRLLADGRSVEGI